MLDTIILYVSTYDSSFLPLDLGIGQLVIEIPLLDTLHGTNCHSMVTRSKLGFPKPKVVFNVSIGILLEPSYYTEARGI